MKIFVPFTKLRSETYSGVPDAILIPLVDRINGYGRYFKERWDAGESFINVEQDIVTTKELIKEMEDCESEVCFASYVYPGQPDRLERGTYLGCVKILADFIHKSQNLFDDQPMRWGTPEGLIWNASDPQNPCFHDSVLHLHIDSRWPIEEINKYG